MDEKKFEDLYRMVQDNNRMLHSMRRSAFVGGIIKMVWWVVLLVVLPYLTWLYIQPYLTSVLEQYQNIQGQGAALQGQAVELQKQLDSLGGANRISEFLKGLGVGGE